MCNLRTAMMIWCWVAVLAAAPVFAQECPRLVGRWPYGPTEVVATGDDGTVYIGSGSTFRAVDVTVPQSPTVVGELVVDDTVSSFAVHLNHAYVAARFADSAGMRVLDISDPHSPQQVGEYECSQQHGSPVVLDAEGEFVYLAHGDLLVLDVSDPTAPGMAGTWPPPSPQSVRAGSVDAQVAYLATYAFGEGSRLHVVDVSDAGHPTGLGYLPFDEPLGDVVAAGNLAYVTSASELSVVDASDPSARTVIGSYSSGTPSAYLTALALSGMTAYVTDGPSGLVRIIDVSDPLDPVEVGAFPSDWTQDLAISPGLCFAADGPRGLQVADVSIPASAAVVGLLPGAGESSHVDSNGVVAVVADATAGGLRILDVSDPASTSEIAWLEFPFSNPVRSHLVGDLAILTSQATWIVDVSDPYLPILLSATWCDSSCHDVVVDGNRAFLAREHYPPSGLLVLDVADPTAPYELGSCGDWHGSGVAVDSSYAYAVGSDGLHVVDVSNPALPNQLGSFTAEWSSLPTRVAVADGLAFAVPGYEALHVIDVSDPNAPAEVAVYDEPYTFLPTDVVLDNGRALVSAGGPGTLRVIDVTFPTAPFQAGASGLGLHAPGVAVSGDLAYVAAGSGGVAIFDLSGCDAIVFRDDFESSDTSRWPATVP